MTCAGCMLPVPWKRLQHSYSSRRKISDYARMRECMYGQDLYIACANSTDSFQSARSVQFLFSAFS